VQRFSAPPPARLGARASGRDPYTELLHESRSLRTEDQQAREGFLRRLAPDRRDALFELEILLKGLVCFGNPRNHPGRRATQPATGAANFHAPLAVMAHGLRRVLRLAQHCLGSFDRPSTLQRDLVFALPEDRRAAPAADSPESALLALRRSLTSLTEVAEGLLRLDHIPFRLFFALAGAIRREVTHNSFFNPLSALEFRPEFDRIGSPEILDLIRRAPGEQAQRLAALTFLSMFRMLRYLTMLEAIGTAAGQADTERARVLLILAVLRADARSLSLHLRRRAGELLAESFEREVLLTPARELEARRDALRATARKLIEMRNAFDGIVANLHLELRRVFERLLPSPSSIGVGGSVDEAARQAIGALRAALHGDLLLLGRAMGRSLDDQNLFAEQPSKRQRAERLRQQVWMFAQILRAFAAKARHAHGDEDRWATTPDVEFAREFLTYFRAIGYGLLRGVDYERLEAFVEATAPLQEPDVLDAGEVTRAIAQCDALHEYLQTMLEQLGAREELAGVLFDKRAAADALRMYLGD
jgi:hypothetical protein